MHTIIADVCTGCELCIKPCPVDCIELKPSASHSQQFKNQSRERYQKHLHRLENRKQQELENSAPLLTETEQEREAVITAAVQRARHKKNAKG
jgi:electron transport complex protein RnfB